MHPLSEIENFLYYIWIISMVFIGISAILSEIYDKIEKNQKSEWIREGNRLIRCQIENEENQRRKH